MALRFAEAPVHFSDLLDVPRNLYVMDGQRRFAASIPGLPQAERPCRQVLVCAFEVVDLGDAVRSTIYSGSSTILEQVRRCRQEADFERRPIHPSKVAL
jgi:hypothetical protein